MRALRQYRLWLPAFVVGLVGCMDFGPSEPEHFEVSGRSVLICNEGNFMYGNASLSCYLPTTGEVDNEIFIRANDMRLGDVAHSVTLHDSILYVVVNNSGVVFAIDSETFTLRGALTGVNSPRYLHIASATKGYLSDLYDSRINIFNPQTMALTGYVATPSHPSTECLIALDERLFVNCWSRDNTILAIDTATDSICDSIHLEGQPRKMVVDSNKRLWVVTDCGTDGKSTPRLYRLSSNPLAIESAIILPHLGPVDLDTNTSGNTIYLLNHHIWAMDTSADELPPSPLIEADGRLLYSIGVDPYNDDIYAADALDYIQSGVVFRYNRYGTLLDSFTAGIIPGSFCFTK